MIFIICPNILLFGASNKKHGRLNSSSSRKKESEVAQSCPTFCNRIDCSLPGSSVYGIFQARILEWVAIPFSRGIFSIQELNLGLLHFRQAPYHLSHQGKSVF